MNNLFKKAEQEYPTTGKNNVLINSSLQSAYINGFKEAIRYITRLQYDRASKKDIDDLVKEAIKNY